MGLFGGFNPFTFSKKQAAAWNALMAAYTFHLLSKTDQEKVIDKVVEIESSAKGRPVTFLEITANMSEAQRYYFFSLALMNLGIRPVLGNDLWHEVRNPYTDIYGAEEVLASTKHKLEKQFSVDFPNIST